MLIAVHVVMLVSVVCVTVAALIWCRGPTERRRWAIVYSTVPIIVLGAVASSVLSINGVPIAEWTLPAFSVLLVGTFCRSDVVFQRIRWTMFAVATALCVNFMMLTHSAYTSSPHRSKAFHSAMEQGMLRQAAKALVESKGLDVQIPEGPISEILPTAVGKFDSVDRVGVEREWHTFLTRLYRLRRTKTAVWHRGGIVAPKGATLELRPVEKV